MNEPDQYELYLTDRMLAGRVCELEGINKVDLFDVISGLQNAHDRIVNRQASNFLVGLVKGLGEGKFTAAQIGIVHPRRVDRFRVECLASKRRTDFW